MQVKKKIWRPFVFRNPNSNSQPFFRSKDSLVTTYEVPSSKRLSGTDEILIDAQANREISFDRL